MNKNLKLIIKTILFILDMKHTDVCKDCSFSYQALKNYLTKNSNMRMENIKQIFDVLNFDFGTAIIIASSKKSRIEIIKSVLSELQKECE